MDPQTEQHIRNMLNLEKSDEIPRAVVAEYQRTKRLCDKIDCAITPPLLVQIVLTATREAPAPKRREEIRV